VRTPWATRSRSSPAASRRGGGSSSATRSSTCAASNAVTGYGHARAFARVRHTA
jgi:hypothetical protein